ncbi:MAG: hypothetical protein JW946_02200 [Candidatus Omnitrophica bacterium]|nr:hypothetical protein [Candidatus Omnitrophota bacterium]
MDDFKLLFGIDKDAIKSTCVLVPFLNKDMMSGFGVKNVKKAKLYGVAQKEDFSLIYTGVGTALLGDCALYLERTKCENIILFGSCGLVKAAKPLSIGSIICPDKCYSFESFSDMLHKDHKVKVFYPDKGLREKLISHSASIKQVSCATLGSIKLEERYIDYFIKNGIDAVDMECSALFSAAAFISRKAAAVLYVSDIIKEKPFYEGLGFEDEASLSSCAQNAARLLTGFIKSL